MPETPCDMLSRNEINARRRFQSCQNAVPSAMVEPAKNERITIHAVTG